MGFGYTGLGFLRNIGRLIISTDTCFVLKGLISVAQKIECRIDCCHQSIHFTELDYNNMYLHNHSSMDENSYGTNKRTS